MNGVRVDQIVAALLHRFPPAWAEPWDRIGLVAGDPNARVTRILVALDLDDPVLESATTWGAGLIITHHPPFLDDVGDLTPGRGGAGVAWRAVRAGIAVASLHTNLDRSPEGASALPRALGLEPGVPLENEPADADLIVAYCSAENADAVLEAMSAAGAGRVGDYEDCAFVGTGEGSFAPLERARPTFGSPGERQRVSEMRVEMLCERAATPAVLTAAAEAHTYEEPVLLAVPARLRRGIARLGRLCTAPQGTSVGSLGRLVSDALGVAPRIWGDADVEVGLIACVNGSASKLVDAVLASGANALVCGEVGYHAAHEAAAAGVSIIEAGHDATEAPLVPVLAGAARTAVEDDRVEVLADDTRPRWWTWGVT